MEEEAYSKKLRELIKKIANFPEEKQKQLGPLIEETKKRHEDIKESSDRITESLIDLRICIEYLLFDIEATRRERDQLQIKLELELENKDEDEDDSQE